MSVEKEVCSIIADLLGVDPLSVALSDSLHDDLGADSLDMVQLQMNLEEHFGCRVPDGDMIEWVTVKDVVITMENLI